MEEEEEGEGAWEKRVEVAEKGRRWEGGGKGWRRRG